jgi:hypothetical protein
LGLGATPVHAEPPTSEGAAGESAAAESAPYRSWRGERVAPPGVLEATEPPPLERPFELSRRPAEVATELGVTFPLCSDDAAEACSALGAGFAGAAVAMYRPSPYFAAGGALSYSLAGGRLGDAHLRERVLGLGARLRVYLVEQGELDPYLELGFGFAEVRGSFAEREWVHVGPFGEVAGGADILLGRNLKLGAAVSGCDVLVRGTRAERRLGAVIRVSASFGESL